MAFSGYVHPELFDLNNKASFDLKNKKLIKKLLVPECQNYDVKLRNFWYLVPIQVSYKKGVYMLWEHEKRGTST